MLLIKLIVPSSNKNLIPSEVPPGILFVQSSFVWSHWAISPNNKVEVSNLYIQSLYKKAFNNTSDNSSFPLSMFKSAWLLTSIPSFLYIPFENIFFSLIGL